ncbi:unnamed protein product [Prunus armeniaca]|uniref:Uncharacterized protein n=1 Tax=Prunus armeniaca TaxID=36596 RepID=A0A6J5VUB4_PRUAR|nr:unnamed protein product [Prunus armeniaca]CAB4321344.1 unnamed protein product [Prunus armeniaca]
MSFIPGPNPPIMVWNMGDVDHLVLLWSMYKDQRLHILVELTDEFQWTNTKSARPKCVNADPHTLTTTAPSGQHHPCSIP